MKYGIYIFLIILFFLPHQTALASSERSTYVLPYPSFMPGNKLYTLSALWDGIMKYWYFGNFGTYTYNLNQSDKFLVEAKTLFEYNQYLLAIDALAKSDAYFIDAYKALSKAQAEGENISQKQNELREASLKHKEILADVKNEVPGEFVWSPEKKESTRLLLWKSIDNSIHIRQSMRIQ